MVPLLSFPSLWVFKFPTNVDIYTDKIAQCIAQIRKKRRKPVRKTKCRREKK